MSKILINDGASTVLINDCGVAVLPTESYTIPPTNYPLFAASSDVIKAIADATLTLNDGSEDVTVVSDAVDIIKGWSPQTTTTIVSNPPFFFDYAGVPSGPGPTTLISFTNTGSTAMDLNRLEFGCRQDATLQVQQNGNVIGTCKTGVAHPKDNFVWYPARQAAPGDLIEVILTKWTGSPDVDVAAHLMGSTET